MRTLIIIFIILKLINSIDYDEISYIDYLETFKEEDKTQEKLNIILNCEFEDINEFYDL